MKLEVKCVEKAGLCKPDPAYRLSFTKPSASTDAKAPPEVMLQMGDQPPDVADRFELGKTYTLTIEGS